MHEFCDILALQIFLSISVFQCPQHDSLRNVKAEHYLTPYMQIPSQCNIYYKYRVYVALASWEESHASVCWCCAVWAE